MNDAPFWKTTITIYSGFDPSAVELSYLAREAETGDAICTDLQTETVNRDDMPEEAQAFWAEEETG